jgi:polar amino acid transport system substrate-binding protein/arginine/ornithine transport system substrate-binding protein
MKIKFMITAIAGAFALFSMTASADGHALRVGVEGAYPPFSWKESDGSLKGFDIDMAMEVCKRLDKKCVLIEQEWDGMIPALLAKKFDTIIASMSITEERKKKVDFTIKYYNTPAKLVAKTDPGFDGTASGLNGKRLGVQRATTHQCSAEKLYPGAEIVLYATQEEVWQDLVAGRLDAQLSDSLQAYEGFLSLDAGKGYDFLGENLDDIVRASVRALPSESKTLHCVTNSVRLFSTFVLTEPTKRLTTNTSRSISTATNAKF